ncbi:MAG: 50S ribosome-binding protein YggL [Spongiibacteraceae bacterium]|jgi:uncharacterized protein YggL (DUF469 family)
MTKEVVRSKRLRKKLYLGEFAIKGFDFTCKIDITAEAEYEKFINAFADLVDARNLFVSLDNVQEMFEGFVTSGERYGSATEQDQKAIEAILTEHSIISDISIGNLVDAFYEV